MMRALTVTQPWSGLIASGVKLIENRTRRPPGSLLGEQFAIHAGRQIDREAWRSVIEIAPELAIDYPGPMLPGATARRFTGVTSAVLAVATLVTYVTHPHQIPEYTAPEQRRWFFGPIGYVLRDVVALPEPVPCKGALGFWKLSADVERAVRGQLGERAA